MTITLTAEQQAWFEAHVARGEYVSAEDAARQLIDAAILDHAVIDDDDLAWAKPLLDEALAQVDRGETISGDVVLAELQAFVAGMKR